MRKLLRSVTFAALVLAAAMAMAETRTVTLAVSGMT